VGAWTDYFQGAHFEKYPELHTCSTRPPRRRRSGAKGSMDPAKGQELLDLIAEIDKSSGDQGGLSPRP